MTDERTFAPTHSNRVTQARADGAPVPPEAIDAWPILLITRKDGQPRDLVLGHSWIVPDAADPRRAMMHTCLTPEALADAQALDRAASVERYNAALLIGSRRFDQVRLERLSETQARTAEGARSDARLAAVLAEIRARGGAAPG